MKLPQGQFGFTLWALATVLLTLGALTTVIDLTHAGSAARIAANANKQRFLVNASNGAISLGSPGSEKTADKQFDVATPEEAKAEAKAIPAVEKPPEAEAVATAADTPAAAPDTPDAAAMPPEKAAAPEPASAPAATPSAPHAANMQGSTPLRTSPITVRLDAPTRTKDSLVSAPAPEVSEEIDGMSIPKRGDRNVTPSTLYAHPFKRKPEDILISFVITNAGLDTQSIGLIMGLPQEVTVAYSPYTRSGESYSEHLRATGHEVWTVLPAMGENYPNDDPGPMGLAGRMPPEEVVRRLHLVMGSVAGAVGLILPPEEALTGAKDTMNAALAEISKRGLLLAVTHPAHRPDQFTSNKEYLAIIHHADLVLDPTPNEAQIRSRLAGILDAAREKGEYTVVLSARPQSLQILSEWLGQHPMSEPFILAPLSAMYQPKVKPETEEAPPAESRSKKDDKSKPPPRKKKVLPQDQYRQPAKNGEKKADH